MATATSRSQELKEKLAQAITYIETASYEREHTAKLLEAILEFFPKDRHGELARIHALIRQLREEPDAQYGF